MSLLWSILLALLSLGAFAAAVYYSIVVRRVVITLTRTPRVRSGLAQAPTDADLPSVCVIVPAHNEQRVVATIVKSLLSQQYPKLRIVFALDRCTDQTRRILEDTISADDRVEIIEIDNCPADWAGKPHALSVAAAQSSVARESDMLLFVDADTELDPLCVKAAVGLLLERKLDLLSLVSTLSHRRWFERIVQPMTVIELMRQHPLYRVNDDTNPRPFANGQFLLFRRTSYESLGGHERVKDHLLEDIAFARALKKDNGRWGVFLAGDMLRCAMYGTWESFRAGWKRISIESAHRKPARLRQYARRMYVLYTVLPVIADVSLVVGAETVRNHPNRSAPFAIAAIALGVVGLGAWAAAMVLAYRTQGARVWSVLLSPIGAWLAADILNQAADDLERNRPLTWGGKTYTNLMQRPEVPGAGRAPDAPVDTL